MKLLRTILCLCAALSARAGIDVVDLQNRIAQGRAEDARRVLNLAVEEDPQNPFLLYNRAIASYAAGKFEEALVDLDLVEDSKRAGLGIKAQFQKGNAQFHIGLANLNGDLEIALSRWRQSIAEYGAVLKANSGHKEARANQEHVRKRLLDLLMKMGAQNLQTAMRSQAMDQKINTARAAMDEFHEAAQIEPQNQAAKQGEDQAREVLANALAQEGERRALSTNLVMGSRHEPAIPRPDTARIEEGVNMLQDAQNLKPQDQNISDKLDQAKDRLADALTTQAETYASYEPRIKRIDEKLGILRMAMELLEKALAERPKHERARQALEQVKQRLAQVHEDEGDQLEQRAQNASLEQQAADLSAALDHFLQAGGLQPERGDLPQKAQNTQARLEQALEQLGDQLMKAPNGSESLDQQVMRMEGASQAFNELESLRPTPQVSEKARAAAAALEALRKQLAESGKPQQAGPPQFGPGQLPPQDNEGVPMDSPPRLDAKGKNGRYQSGSMNRSLRDY